MIRCKYLYINYEFILICYIKPSACRLRPMFPIHKINFSELWTKKSHVAEGWQTLLHLITFTTTTLWHSVLCGGCLLAATDPKYFLPSVGQLFLRVSECLTMCKCKSSLVLFVLQLLGQLVKIIASPSVHYGYGFNKVVGWFLLVTYRTGKIKCYCSFYLFICGLAVAPIS